MKSPPTPTIISGPYGTMWEQVNDRVRSTIRDMDRDRDRVSVRAAK